jgi:hypothetical protein
MVPSGLVLGVVVALCARSALAGQGGGTLTLATDSQGMSGTFSASGNDPANPFFKSLGTNGRSCSTCHIATEAMSFTPEHAQELYQHSQGTDPLFARVDGANCSGVRPADRQGHSLILRSGLIRIALPVPDNAQFSISVVHDPYGCALQVDPSTGVLTASVYRRPLPATNLRFLSAIMFDGRETVAPLTVPSSFQDNLRTDLAHQAVDATTGHAQASNPPSDATVDAIVAFELGLYSAQYEDFSSGLLDIGGAFGGPVRLAGLPYHPGINDSLGEDPSGAAFTPVSMLLYSAWNRPASSNYGHQGESRADIAAGEQIFNSAPMTISNVRGLNDNPSLNNPTSFVGHCATCHDTPNVGDHSLPLPLDIGTGHSADPNFESDPLIQAAMSQLSGADLPVFLIAGCPNPFNPGQTESFYTTDPGKALISGQCSDFNRIKGPILRGLAARAPYFHNGAAASLTELVNFYNQRFQMNLSERQKRQLVAFLNSL